MNEHYSNSPVNSAAPPQLIHDRIGRIDDNIQRLAEGLAQLDSRLTSICAQEPNGPRDASAKTPPACCALDERLMDMELRMLAQLDNLQSIFRRLKI